MGSRSASPARGDAIKGYLVYLGIGDGRISAEGVGEVEPIADIGERQLAQPSGRDDHRFP